MKPDHSACAVHALVAADASRRHLRGGENAPTDVGGYNLSANPVPRTTHHAPRTSPAFTLLELLMVIAIMGIVAALALPSIRGLKPNAKVAATRQLLDAVSRARQLALSQHTTVYMVFVSTNFWTDPAYAYNTTWNTNNQAAAASLLDKQLMGYAYVALRSVGDQPGAPFPHYLSPWRKLPQGAFIDPRKFMLPGNSFPVGGLTLTNVTLPDGTFPTKDIRTFSVTNTIPFPLETTPAIAGAYTYLPYIAFDSTGRLASGGGQPELIPISEGSVSFARDPSTKVAQPQAAQANEQPLNNTIENYSLIYIDPLTGRAHVERRKVQ